MAPQVMQKALRGVPGLNPGHDSRYGVLVFSVDGSGLSAVRRMAAGNAAVELMRCTPLSGSASFEIQMVVAFNGLSAMMRNIGLVAAENGFVLQHLSSPSARTH